MSRGAPKGDLTEGRAAFWRPLAPHPPAPGKLHHKGFPGGSDGKESFTMQETWVSSLGREDPLEEGMATLSNILAWEISQTEEPDGIQPMELQRVRHN